MRVLIFSQETDIHVASVVKHFSQMGIDYVLFERFRRDHKITFNYQNSACDVFFEIGNTQYSLLNDFTSVWWRMKPVIAAELPSEEGDLTEKYIVQEWRQLLAGLQYIIPGHIKQINNRIATESISKKIVQLQLAQSCGLLIPPTCVTNSLESIDQYLFNDDKPVIHKTLSSFFSKEKVVYTTEVSLEEIQNDPDSVTIAPSIYQKRIDKAHELRVTVVGNNIFTAQVNSQEKEESKLDWRLGNQSALFSEGQLSQKTSQQLLDFHHRAGLIYAAYDFIVAPDNTEIFLECNPNGQWLWLEDGLGMDISLAIAKELVN